jgi:SPP1 gp7 family putative phage head morphogenesis protein
LIAESNRWLLDDDYRAANIVTNAYEFTQDPQSIVNFMVFLQSRIDSGILEVNRSSTGQIISTSGWMIPYTNDAYLRGVMSSRADLIKMGVPLGQLMDNATVATLQGGIVPSLELTTDQNIIVPVTGNYMYAAPLVKPIHLEALRVAYTRDFTDLQGITTEMSQQIRREIIDGMESNLHTREIAKNINDRINKIGLTRAKTLARTEVGRAFRVAGVNDSIAIQKEFDLPLEFHYQWVTAKDERVRSAHAARHGRVYTAEEVRPLIGDVNCRCNTIEVLPEFVNRKDKKKAAKERRALLARVG